MPVLILRALTLTFGTRAPEGSDTVPPTEAVIWPKAMLAKDKAMAAVAQRKAKVFMNGPPLGLLRDSGRAGTHGPNAGRDPESKCVHSTSFAGLYDVGEIYVNGNIGRTFDNSQPCAGISGLHAERSINRIDSRYQRGHQLFHDQSVFEAIRAPSTSASNLAHMTVG